MYRTVAQLDSIARILAVWFPGYFTLIQLPESSVQGRPVYALRLRAGGGGERRGVMVVGGTHSRELMNPDAIIELAVDLFLSHINGTDIVYGGRRWTATEVKTILEALDLWLVPCINPDGRDYVMTVDNMWRKNRRDNPATSCDGVDLNRNSDIVWGVTQGQTSCSPCSDVYCGPSAFSEPETRNVKFLLDTRRVDTFVDVHSYSELVLWPWGHAPTQTTDPSKTFTTLPTGTCQPIAVPGYQEYMPPHDLERFQTVGARIVQAIADVRGRNYTNEPSVTLYPVTGAQSDYVHSRHIANPSLGKTYGFTFETGPFVGNAADSFHPADPTLIKRDTKSGLIALMQQSICAIELIGTTFFTKDTEVNALRAVRDDLLATTASGRAWINLYERVQLAVVAAVLADPAIAKQAAATVKKAAGLTKKRGQGILADEEVDRGLSVLAALRERPETASVTKDLRLLERHLDSLRGVSLATAIEQMMAAPPSSRAHSPRRASARRSNRQ
jgi:murein tripeptide amidase MpaA